MKVVKVYKYQQMVKGELGSLKVAVHAYSQADAANYMRAWFNMYPARLARTGVGTQFRFLGAGAPTQPENWVGGITTAVQESRRGVN